MPLLDANDDCLPPVSRRVLVSLGAVILLGAGLRLYGLGAWGFWVDEGAIVKLAGLPLARLFDPDYSNDPPLFTALMHFWIKLVNVLPGTAPGGEGRDVALRLFPCLVGILTIPVVFLLGRVLFRDDRTALLGAFVFAIAPFQVYYAQEFRSYTLHAALAAAALLFVLRALQDNRPRDWIAWVVCAVAGIYNNFFMVWVILSFNVCFVAVMPWYANRVKRWIVANLAVIVLAIPALKLALYYSVFFEKAREVWYPAPTLRLLLLTFKAFFAAYSPSRIVYDSMALLAGALSLWAVVQLRRRPRILLTLLIIMLVPIIGNAIYFRLANFPYYTHRLMITSAIPCYLLVACGLRALRRTVGIAAAVLFIALTVPALADIYANRLHTVQEHRVAVLDKIDTRGAARCVRERIEPGDVIGHRVRYTLFPFTHYLTEAAAYERALCFTEIGCESIMLGYPHRALPENLGSYPVRVEGFTRDAPRVWYVQSFWEPHKYDPEGELLRRWLDGHFFRDFRRPFDGLTLFRYVNAPEERPRAEEFQLADFGSWDQPYYIFPDTPAGRAAGASWEAAFLDEYVEPAQAVPDQFALYFDTVFVAQAALPGTPDGRTVIASEPRPGRAVTASFPLEAAGSFQYRVCLANGAEAARTLEVRVVESTEVIEPLSFNRVEPESDAWQPMFQYDGGPPPGIFNIPAMMAQVNENVPADGAIARDLDLPPGAYDVWARIIQAPDPVASSRLEARFAMAPLDDAGAAGLYAEIGATDGGDPACTFGWAWRRIGSWQGDGRVVRLRVTSANPHGFATGYFDLGRVAFVCAGAAFDVHAESVVLQPSERRALEFSSDMNGSAVRRVDIEAFDPAVREFRRVHAYIRHP